MIRPTLRLRLTAWYASIFLLGGGALLAVSYVIVSHNTASFPSRAAREAIRLGAPPALSGTDGTLTGPVRRKTAPKPRGIGKAKVTVNPTGSAPLPKPTRAYLAKLARIQTAAEKTVRGQMHREVAIDFGFALLATTLLSLLAGWLVAGRALRPVSRITAAARRVATHGDLGERIALDGPADELRELAETFDAMLARLDRAFTNQRSFVANASHELRTPLAVMRAEIEERIDDPAAGESELRAMAAVIHEAIGRSETLITSLLTLARSQQELRHREHIDLAELARNATHALAATREQQLTVEAPSGAAQISGNRELLDRLLGNLLENATRYNQPGGFIRLEISRNDRAVTLTITNSGPLIPATAVPHLFEPFFRVDNSRSRESGGAGLGLAIVAAITDAHGGTANVARRDEGGLIVTVTLPTGAPLEPGEPNPRTRTAAIRIVGAGN